MFRFSLRYCCPLLQISSSWMLPLAWGRKAGTAAQPGSGFLKLQPLHWSCSDDKNQRSHWLGKGDGKVYSLLLFHRQENSLPTIKYRRVTWDVWVRGTLLGYMKPSKRRWLKNTSKHCS